MKRKTFRYLSVVLSLICALTVCLAGCQEYNPAVSSPGHGRETGEESTEKIVVDDDGNIDPNPFTVTLMVDGRPYSPPSDQPISVRWSDGFSLHTAPVEEDGVARIGGLDGDYDVTLTAVPEGYAYNPNVHRATGNQRNIEIELYRLVETKGQSHDLYNAIRIRSTGVYCIEISGADKEVYFEFAPTASGTYSVESWMDTEADNVNPSANYYGSNSAFRTFQYCADDGGAEAFYTKNFKLDVQIAEENFSGGGGGAVVFTFGVKATSKTNEYPIKVYFALTLDGEFILDRTESVLMRPAEELVQQPDYLGYEFVGAERQETVGDVSGWTFDADNYKLWPKDEGGDGYYHVYSTAEYPDTHGYGPILYAKISSPCRFLTDAFTTLEYNGNKALTLSDGTENYKLFIEGFDALNSTFLGSPYFCTTDCPCRRNGTCDSMDIIGSVGACVTGCTGCHQDCRNIPEDLIGQKGYGDYTNSDGCYAVTEELKEFLQKYSISQLLFFDGDGYVETHESIHIFAEEEDQWLFACGYYRKKT